jgi:hypothetical protein
MLGLRASMDPYPIVEQSCTAYFTKSKLGFLMRASRLDGTYSVMMYNRSTSAQTPKNLITT